MPFGICAQVGRRIQVSIHVSDHQTWHHILREVAFLGTGTLAVDMVNVICKGATCTIPSVAIAVLYSKLLKYQCHLSGARLPSPMYRMAFWRFPSPTYLSADVPELARRPRPINRMACVDPERRSLTAGVCSAAADWSPLRALDITWPSPPWSSQNVHAHTSPVVHFAKIAISSYSAPGTGAEYWHKSERVCLYVRLSP